MKDAERSRELKYSKKFADKLPRKIILWVIFPNKGIIILLILSLLSVLFLKSYLFNSIEGVILTFVAVGFFLVGFYQTIVELAKLEIETALINIIRKNGEDYLKEGEERIPLEMLFDRLSVENKSNPAINRLIKHIVGDAKMNKFDSGINLLQPYKDEAIDIIFSLQHYQKLVLWVGIGGTFIGILQSMKASDFKKLLESGNAVEFAKIIPLMFDGLVIAFSASLAGLLSAVIIGGLISITRKKQKFYFHQIENVVNIILNSALKCRYENIYLREIDTLREDLNSSERRTKELQSETAQLQGRIVEFQEKIIEQNKEVKKSVDEFLKTNKIIFDISNATKEEVKHTQSSSLLKSALQESIQSASQQMSAAIGQRAASMTDQIMQFTKLTTQLNESVKSFSQIIENNRQQSALLNNQIVGSLNSVSNAINKLKSPQNWAIWVVGAVVLVALIAAIFGTRLFSIESNKSDNSYSSNSNTLNIVNKSNTSLKNTNNSNNSNMNTR